MTPALLGAVPDSPIASPQAVARVSERDPGFPLIYYGGLLLQLFELIGP